jgi:hypothetical protein
MIIYVGIPCIDGKPYASMVDSLLAEQVLAQPKGVYLLVGFLNGCSLIGHARNHIADGFLKVPEADCMVMIDSDISWTAGELVKLAQRPEDVIGGTYRTKQDEEKFHVHGSVEKDGDLYRVGGLPGGFLKISRKAFDRIDAKQYQDGPTVLKDYFPTGIVNGAFYGEDYGFCRLWQQAGGTVWLDPSIILRHHESPSRAYTGNPAEWLENRTQKVAA